MNDSDIPVDQAAPPATTETTSDEAVAELETWYLRHITNSRFSRDTRALNQINDSLAAVRAAMDSVKE